MCCGRFAQRRWRGPDDPRLTHGYWNLAPAEAVTHHWSLLAQAYKGNAKVLEPKMGTVKWCVVSLAVEVLALFLWLAITT